MGIFSHARRRRRNVGGVASDVFKFSGAVPVEISEAREDDQSMWRGHF
jgi:hypothetical protein